MPPNLDIYVFTMNRDLNTINSFLDSYVDRTASENRDGEEIMLRKLDVVRIEMTKSNEGACRSYCVERGSIRRHSRSIWRSHPRLDGAVLCFER